MSDTKEIYARFVREVINDGDADALDRFMVEDVIDSGHAGFGSGRDAMKAFVRALHSGFSDITIDVQWSVADGDRLGVWAPMTGTHDGEFFGVAATGARIAFNTCGFFRFEGEMIAEHQGFIDVMAIAQAVGVIGPPPWTPTAD